MLNTHLYHGSGEIAAYLTKSIARKTNFLLTEVLRLKQAELLKDDDEIETLPLFFLPAIQRATFNNITSYDLFLSEKQALRLSERFPFCPVLRSYKSRSTGEVVYDVMCDGLVYASDQHVFDAAEIAKKIDEKNKGRFQCDLFDNINEKSVNFGVRDIEEKGYQFYSDFFFKINKMLADFGMSDIEARGYQFIKSNSGKKVFKEDDIKTRISEVNARKLSLEEWGQLFIHAEIASRISLNFETDLDLVKKYKLPLDVLIVAAFGDGSLSADSPFKITGEFKDFDQFVSRSLDVVNTSMEDLEWFVQPRESIKSDRQKLLPAMESFLASEKMRREIESSMKNRVKIKTASKSGLM